MPDYRRAYTPGEAIFLTLVTFKPQTYLRGTRQRKTSTSSRRHRQG